MNIKRLIARCAVPLFLFGCATKDTASEPGDAVESVVNTDPVTSDPLYVTQD